MKKRLLFYQKRIRVLFLEQLYYNMNEEISDLPDWDDEKLVPIDDLSEAWKPSASRDACKLMYKHWQSLVYILKALLLPIIEDNNLVDESLKDRAEDLLQTSLVIGLKIRTSETEGLYIFRMENAAVVRKLALDIDTTIPLFTGQKNIDKSYIDAIHKEIDDFRKLFIIWINTFEKDEFKDEWGLFI